MLAVCALVLGMTGCSRLGLQTDKALTTPVLRVKAGDCVLAPENVTEKISSLSVVDCSKPHPMEAYAVVAYKPASGAAVPDVYPGEAPLKAFAEGACLEQFSAYVGVDYRDSGLFFTYLLPSAQDWGNGKADTSVSCFVTTTGKQLTTSVKHAKA